MLRKLFVLFALGLAMVIAAGAQEKNAVEKAASEKPANDKAANDRATAAKFADIRRLMDMTGSAAIGKQFATAISRQMFQNMKAIRPDVPDRAIDIMDRELTALMAENMSGPNGLLDQVIPIYDKFFSHAEIRELIRFYQSPIGKKSLSVLPQVVNESMQAGQRWGEALVPEMERRVHIALEREGIVVRK